MPEMAEESVVPVSVTPDAGLERETVTASAEFATVLPLASCNANVNPKLLPDNELGGVDVQTTWATGPYNVSVCWALVAPDVAVRIGFPAVASKY
jgi:hypothetical protein